MSTVSFIDRAAEERRECLVVGGVLFGAHLVIGLERIEHGVHRLVGIGGLALPLHLVEVVHIGLIGLFIVAEQTHRFRPSSFDDLRHQKEMVFGGRRIADNIV